MTYSYTLGRRFGAICARFGERPALRFPSGLEVTYRELDARANRIAAVLLARGIAHRSVVAIAHAKSLDGYAAMIACLKIGAIYVNVDRRNPPVRLAHVLRTAGASLVFVDAADEPPGALATFGIDVLDAADPAVRRAIDAAPNEEPPGTERVTSADPAYVMFTSGSTGIPKGAVMSHGGVLNFGAWIAERFDVTERDALTNVNPMYFDNSVFDFYGALLNGATLLPVPAELVARPADMIAALEAARATVWFSVPSFLIYLMSLGFLDGATFPTLRAFVFGGEGYPKPELRKLFDCFGATKTLYNVYGPTECTCMCSAWIVRASDFDEPLPLVTLGRIAANFSFHVLDESMQPVPVGESGELYLGGPQVGLGYMNDPERTAAAFVVNPGNAGWAERLYRTGDLVRLRSDGATIDFVGRRDHQVKHLGYRIELEEIEAALNELPVVRQAAVVHVADGAGFSLLAAYVGTSEELGSAEVLEHLRRRVPSYMIPERIEFRADLPKNANGKIDRPALAREARAAVNLS